MSKGYGRAIAVIAATVISGFCAFAQPTPGQALQTANGTSLPFLSPIFGDNMVLQRGKPDAIWGWADSGETVRVEIGGKTATGIAGADHRWQVSIDPPAAVGPYTVRVTGRQTVELHNILVGDVWLCGGQSNMGLPLRFTKNADEEINAANYPQIRFFTVGGHPAYHHVDVIEGKWQVVSPVTASSVSAVGYYFARRVQKDIHVPIGLVVDAVGGSPAESWTSETALRPLHDFDVPLAELDRLKAANGRGQETYGEDPFLTARMGVAYVTGLQGNGPKYYLAMATPKHYAVHSGPEPTRHFADVDVSKHDEVDTYEPAFRAAIVEGKPGSVMCAYNAINGEPACANQYLLQDQLRGKWGFQGYVVSDCDAVRDVAANHRYRPTQAQGAAISVIRGMDNECVTFTSRFGEPVEKAYVDAVQQGYLPEAVLDNALIRLFTARMKLGMFDPPDMVPYTKVDEKQLDSAEHRAHARKLANESMVLLKNDGLLPLKPSIKKIAVVGPLAD